MPQFNHFETKSGQQIDPTFGLNALSEETKRKTKAREQMNIAANVIRQSLAADGKGLTKGTEVNIEEGGQYTFNGDNATKDETNLYNIRKANYGKTGTGTNVTTKANFAPEQAALAKQAQDEAAMAVPHNTLRGGGTLTPTPTPTTVVPDNARPSVSELPADQQAAIARTAIASTFGGAVIPPAGTTLRSGESVSENLAITDSASNNYQNLKEVTTTSDIEVRDQLGMNQSDLAVASAMEALNSQVYGTVNPGVYKGLMEQNARTMQSTNDALTKQGQSVIMDTLNQGSVNRSMSTSKGSDKSRQQSASSGGGTNDPYDGGYLYSQTGDEAPIRIHKTTGEHIIPGGTGYSLTSVNAIEKAKANGGGISGMQKNYESQSKNSLYKDTHKSQLNSDGTITLFRNKGGKWHAYGDVSLQSDKNFLLDNTGKVVRQEADGGKNYEHYVVAYYEDDNRKSTSPVTLDKKDVEFGAFQGGQKK